MRWLQRFYSSPWSICASVVFDLSFLLINEAWKLSQISMFVFWRIFSCINLLEWHLWEQNQISCSLWSYLNALFLLCLICVTVLVYLGVIQFHLFPNVVCIRLRTLRLRWNFVSTFLTKFLQISCLWFRCWRWVLCWLEPWPSCCKEG